MRRSPLGPVPFPQCRCAPASLMGAGRGGGDIARGASGGDNAIAGTSSQALMHTAATLTPFQSSLIEGEGFYSFLALRADEVIE